MADKIKKIQESLQQLIERVVEDGRDNIIKILKERIKGGKKSSGQPFSLYSESHKKRRENEGLQIGYKDMNFTGTMLNSFKEINRTSNEAFTQITIGFTGNANRRADQKQATNEQVAQWLSDQENYRIVELSETEKQEIKRQLIEKFKGDIGQIDIT